MRQLTRLEVELMTHDPIAQVQRCLSCTEAYCTNCVDWLYRCAHESAKQDDGRRGGHA